jgi:tetratricopeptide (TPR) repeat protein
VESEETHTVPPESKAFDLLAAGNVSAAVAAITAIADTYAALEALAQLCQRAYRDLKSVPTMTALAWEAVGFGLKSAAASPDPECASKYKSRARAIAYNAGANCWPGWGDAVEINPADIAEGLKLAERSYELAGELGLSDKAIGTSLWLVGALQMAAGRLSTAIAQFLRAEEAFQAAQLPVPAAMARGYVALAEKALPESHLRGTESLTTILCSLRRMESREAQFFADQLLTADRIFSWLW